MRSSVFGSFPLFLFSYSDGFSVVCPCCSPSPMRSSVFSSFPPLCLFPRWIFGCFPFLLPRPDAKCSFQQLSFFFLFSTIVVFPFGSPGLMRSSVFSSFFPPFFFQMDIRLFSLYAPPARCEVQSSAAFIFVFFPTMDFRLFSLFAPPWPDAKFSLQQRSFLFFFIRWIFGCFPFVFPPARCEVQFSAAVPPLF